MKQISKRIISLLLCLSMILSMGFVNVFAADEEKTTTSYNLLVNPGAEEVDTTAGTITGWKLGNKATYMTNNPVAGTYGFALNKSGDYIQQAVTVPETTTYKLTGNLSGSGTMGIYKEDGTEIAKVSRNVKAYANLVIDNIELEAGQTVLIKIIRVAGVSTWLNADEFVFATTDTYDYVAGEGTIQLIAAIDGTEGTVGYLGAILAARESYDGLSDAVKPGVSNYDDLLAAEAAITAQYTEYNLLVNPDVEYVSPTLASGSAKAITGWTIYGDSEWATNNPYSGRNNMAMNRSGAYVDQTVTVPETTTYTLSGYIAGNGTFGIYDAAGNEIASISHSDSAYSYEIMEDIPLTAGDVVTIKCARGSSSWLNADNFVFAASSNYKAALIGRCIIRIDEIDGTTGDERERAILDARNAYDALKESEKPLVTNYAKLQAAEFECVQAVIDMIDALGEITADSRTAVEAARSAYEGLTKLQQEQVLNLAVLEEAEAALIALGAVVEQRQTPLMGWSSWNCYYDQITEEKIMLQADAMVSTGLAEAGYIYCNIDDTWQGGRSEETGLVLSGPEKFPSGMKYVADYIHSLGLKAGIYSDAGPNTCAIGRNEGADGTGYGLGVGLYEHEYEDLYQYFVDWGYDYIKADFCGGRDFKPQPLDRETQYTKIGECIDQIELIKGSDIVLNVCCWQWPGEWVIDVGDSVRIASDIRPVWSYILKQVDKALPLAKYVGPGFAADLDMLEVGNGMSYDEDKSHFAMWCMLSAPLVLGNDLTRISDETLEIVSNKELIALNQDPAVIMATVVKTENNVQTWVKPLGSEDSNVKAVALFNMNNYMTSATVSWDEVGFTGDVEARDLYEHRDLAVGDNYTVVLPAHGCVVLKVSGESSYSNESVINATLTAAQSIEPESVGTLDWADVSNGTSKDNAYVIGKATETVVDVAAVSTGRVAYVYFTAEGTATLTATLNGKEASDVFTGNGVYTIRYTGNLDGGDLNVSIAGGAIVAVAVAEDNSRLFVDTELTVSNSAQSGEIDLTEGTAGYVSFAGENGTIAGGSLGDYVTAEDAEITGTGNGAAQNNVYDYFEVYLPAADTLTRANIYYGLINGSATIDIRSGSENAEVDLYNITGGEDGVLTVWYTSAEDVTVVLTLDNTFAGDGAIRIDAVTISEETGVVLTNPEVTENEGTLDITAQTKGEASDVKFIAEVYDAEGTQVASNANDVTLGGQVVNSLVLPENYESGSVKMYLTSGATVIGDVYTTMLPLEEEYVCEYQELIGNLLAQKLVAEGAILIDVRSAEEYEAGHIEGAINIEYTDLLIEAESSLPDKAANIVVYCSAGKRSTQAQMTLNSLGYANVYNIGSMDNWYIEPSVTISLPNDIYIEPGAEAGIVLEANPYEKDLEMYYSLGKDSTFDDAQPISSPTTVTLTEDGWVKGYFIFDGELVATVEEKAELSNWDVSVYISDLFDTWTINDSSYKAAKADVSIDGNTLTIAGTTFSKGIGAHATSVIECAIPDGMTRFVAIAGCDNEVNSGHTRNKIKYAVYIDDVLYDESGEIFRGEYYVFDIAFPANAQTIRLEADQTDDGTTYDHADWGVAGFCAPAAEDYRTVRVTNGTASAEAAVWGETITIFADEPAEGMVFEKWVADDESIEIANVHEAETTLLMPNAEVSVTATYIPEAVADARTAALAELDELRSFLKDSDYKPEQVTELDEAYNAGVTAIKAATTLEDVAAALDAAKTALDDVKSIFDIMNEGIAAAKEAAEKAQAAAEAAQAKAEEAQIAAETAQAAAEEAAASAAEDKAAAEAAQTAAELAQAQAEAAKAAAETAQDAAENAAKAAEESNIEAAKEAAAAAEAAKNSAESAAAAAGSAQTAAEAAKNAQEAQAAAEAAQKAAEEAAASAAEDKTAAEVAKTAAELAQAQAEAAKSAAETAQDAAENAAKAAEESNAEAAKEAAAAAESAKNSAESAAAAAGSAQTAAEAANKAQSAQTAAEDAQKAAEEAAESAAEDKAAAEAAAMAADTAKAQAEAAMDAAQNAQKAAEDAADAAMNSNLDAAKQAAAAAEAAKGSADSAAAAAISAQTAAEAAKAAQDAQAKAEAAQKAAEEAQKKTEELAEQARKEAEEAIEQAKAEAAKAALSVAKYNALIELNEYADSLKKDATEMEQEALSEAVKAAREAINDAADEDAVAEALQAGIAALDNSLCLAKNFSDVALDEWYHDAIDFVLKEGIMNGNGDGTFGPTDALTRAMLVQILYNIEGRPEVETEKSFTDVEADDWYYDAILWAAENEIVLGYDDGSFGAEDNVTREQMVTILYRYAGSPEVTAQEIVFADSDEISDWAVNAVLWAYENKIVQGVSNDMFDPAGASQRAAAAQVMMNYFAK